jgi:hypothetical protein
MSVGVPVFDAALPVSSLPYLGRCTSVVRRPVLAAWAAALPAPAGNRFDNQRLSTILSSSPKGENQ